MLPIATSYRIITIWIVMATALSATGNMAIVGTIVIIATIC